MARVLLVDDDDSIRYLLRIALEHYGHTVSEASNGYEGLQCYKVSSIDVVITDMQMPVMDGPQLLAELRQHFPSAKVIAISGGGSLLHTVKDFNVQHTFVKPFPIEALHQAVQALLTTQEMIGECALLVPALPVSL